MHQDLVQISLLLRLELISLVSCQKFHLSDLELVHAALVVVQIQNLSTDSSNLTQIMIQMVLQNQ